ncbi:hypothetical protein LY474_19710 [Myxococcus stipitatus]|uniref:toxin-antitoxin system YwqK family antitoxin n=1 Tax=Myxococcus stipitatus TaxID=83455 RepID=UPI001F371540|nr:hypothetical protein [Myxococcus stipitatus]MCE9670029.1 hypothetical protein [Myxococcus stipitatus]
MTTRVHAKKVSMADDGLHYCEGQPFTGVAYTEYPDGTLRSETSYLDGLLSGPSRGWSKNGRLVDEAEYLRDVIHGVAREWTPEGVLISEMVCEYGVKKSERKWDDDGTLVEEYVLDESDPNFALLQSFRKLYGPQPA